MTTSRTKGQVPLQMIATIGGYLAAIAVPFVWAGGVKSDVAHNADEINVLKPAVSMLQQDSAYMRGLLEALSERELGKERVAEIRAAASTTTP